MSLLNELKTYRFQTVEVEILYLATIYIESLRQYTVTYNVNEEIENYIQHEPSLHLTSLMHLTLRCK